MLFSSCRCVHRATQHSVPHGRRRVSSVRGSSLFRDLLAQDSPVLRGAQRPGRRQPAGSHPVPAVAARPSPLPQRVSAGHPQPSGSISLQHRYNSRRVSSHCAALPTATQTASPTESEPSRHVWTAPRSPFNRGLEQQCHHKRRNEFNP